MIYDDKKLAGFTFNHVDQDDRIVGDAATLKQGFDSRAEEMRVAFNAALDAIGGEDEQQTADIDALQRQLAAANAEIASIKEDYRLLKARVQVLEEKILGGAQ